MARRRDSSPCPACGADVPAGKPACPTCGADDLTGLGEESEEEVAQELDLPRPRVDDEEYDDFVRSEFGGEDAYRPRGPRAHTLLMIAIAVVVFGLLLWLLTSPKPTP